MAVACGGQEIYIAGPGGSLFSEIAVSSGGKIYDRECFHNPQYSGGWNCPPEFVNSSRALLLRSSGAWVISGGGGAVAVSGGRMTETANCGGVIPFYPAGVSGDAAFTAGGLVYTLNLPAVSGGLAAGCGEYAVGLLSGRYPLARQWVTPSIGGGIAAETKASTWYLSRHATREVNISSSVSSGRGYENGSLVYSASANNSGGSAADTVAEVSSAFRWLGAATLALDAPSCGSSAGVPVASLFHGLALPSGDVSVGCSSRS